MKNVKRLLLVLLLSTLFCFPSTTAYAEERSIYVGDLINIKITTQSLTEDELREKFADFEITELKKESDGYIITVRSFDVGEKTIELDNQELKITVKSTLKDLGRTDIFNGSTGTKPAGYTFAWQFVLYGLILIFLITGGVTARGLIRRKRQASLTPYERFHLELGKIILAEDSCFVRLTKILKQYMDAKLSINIKGKTSSEIVAEVRDFPVMDNKLKDLQSWLEDCDFYKFTKTVSTMEHKQKLLENLKALVKEMEYEKGANT